MSYSRKLRVTREVTPEECDWLSEVVPVGHIVWTFCLPTYGVIAGGIAVSNERDEYPFFELPRDSVDGAA